MITKNFTTLGNELSFDGKNLTYKAYPAYCQKYLHIERYPLLYDKDKVISTYSTKEHNYKIPEDIAKNYCIHCAIIQRDNKHNFPDDPTVYDILYCTCTYHGYDTEYSSSCFYDNNYDRTDIIVYNNPNVRSDFFGYDGNMKWLSPYYFKTKTDTHIVFGWFSHC